MCGSLCPVGRLERIESGEDMRCANTQDVQELTNFFERKVSAYQVAAQGEVAFDQAF